METNIFEDLFVLELANNHFGDVERGKKIIAEFSKIAKQKGIKTAIKLQIRDAENFIQKDFSKRTDIRYVNKVLNTKLSYDEYKILIDEIKKSGCITMATPFDEISVEKCVEFGIEILKIASTDIKDKILIKKIAETKKPVIVSTGGASISDIDDIVEYFDARNIPLAINHCVSIYPSESKDLELNQIDFLKSRYPNHTIGFSTHQYNDDIKAGIFIAYAKGARTFERHIDIKTPDRSPVSYCSEPEDIVMFIDTYLKAKELCGGTGSLIRKPQEKEKEYLDSMTRGVWAKKDFRAGEIITEKDFYLAIPLQKGQISCHKTICGKVLSNDIKKDKPIMIKDIESESLKIAPEVNISDKSVLV